MKTNINIGNNTVEIVCNLGTELLFRRLTGEDFNLKLIEIKNLATSEDQNEKARAGLVMLELAKKLAYVMAKQAECDNIQKLFNLMNDNDFTAWLFNFETSDFTVETYLEIIKAWKGTRSTSVNAKN